MLKDVDDALRQLRRKNDDASSIVSSKRSSRSSRSKSSRLTSVRSTSTARERRLNLEEQVASLKAKATMAQQRKELAEENRRALEELESKKLQLQNEEIRVKEKIENSTKRLLIAEELAEKKARIDACKRFEEEFTPLALPENDEIGAEERVINFLGTQSNTPREDSQVPINPTNVEPVVQGKEPTVRPSSLDPTHPAFTTRNTPSVPVDSHNVTTTSERNNETNSPPTNSNIVQAQLDAISKVLEIQNLNRLPLPEPGTFSGDPLQFPIWLKAFETLIESRTKNSAERLHFLGNYVTSEAKDLIKACDPVNRHKSYKDEEPKKPNRHQLLTTNSKARPHRDGVHRRNVLATESKETEIEAQRNICTFCNEPHELNS
jgi:hypothetical protein